MATVSFFKTFGVETEEEVDRFIDIISQPPKPISEEIRKLGEENDKTREETLKLFRMIERY